MMMMMMIILCIRQGPHRHGQYASQDPVKWRESFREGFGYVVNRSSHHLKFCQAYNTSLPFRCISI